MKCAIELVVFELHKSFTRCACTARISDWCNWINFRPVIVVTSVRDLRLVCIRFTTQHDRETMGKMQRVLSMSTQQVKTDTRSRKNPSKSVLVRRWWRYERKKEQREARIAREKWNVQLILGCFMVWFFCCSSPHGTEWKLNNGYKKRGNSPLTTHNWKSQRS